MEYDTLGWLCSELGLPTVLESEHNVVANGAAQRAGCEPHCATLEAALLVLIRMPSLPAAVGDVLRRARAGERAGCLVAGDDLGQAGFRVVAAPHGPGRAQVVVAPASMDASVELSRRASLVDVAAAVSHEVSNAVGSIVGWAQLASTAGSGVSSSEALRLIAGCARTAQQAARSMLGLARGEQAEEEQDVNLSELAAELLDLLSLTARQQRVSLLKSVEPELVVRGSRAQLFTVLWNLTKNAVEASAPSGTVSISVAASGEGTALEVCDTGVGLDASEIAKVFAPYYTTKTGGTGLGLALVRKAVAELGGEISVQSVKGRGTTFRVSLPRALRQSKVSGRPLHGTAGAAGQAAPGQLPGHSSLARETARFDGSSELTARVLVVDDDDALREMMGTALSLRGADVVTARNSEEARAAEGRFDIALIDMMLDECRGDELLAALRRRGSVSAAMLVTGTVQKPKLVPGGEPDDWVRKPFELSQLVERIRRTLERHRMLSSVTAMGTR